MGDDDAQNM